MKHHPRHTYMKNCENIYETSQGKQSFFLKKFLRNFFNHMLLVATHTFKTPIVIYRKDSNFKII